MVNGELHRCSTHTKNRKMAMQWAENISIARKAPSFEDAVEVLRIMFNRQDDSSIGIDTAWETYERMAQAVGKLNIAAKTLKTRKLTLERFIEWLKRNSANVRTIEGVTGEIAVAYAEHLSCCSSRKSHTRKNIISDLSVIWKMLEKKSGKVSNPWKNIAPTITDGTRIMDFTPKQQNAVLKAAKEVGDDWYPICVIALHTGLRYGSIATLTWDDVNMDEGTIHLKPRKTERYDIAVDLPIIKPLMDILKDIPRTGKYLFPLHAKLYNKTSGNRYRRIKFKNVLDAAGIKGEYTFHSWRHTASTRLAKAGADIETRKKILGHTQDSTAARYDHDSHLGEIRKAMEKAAKEK